MTQAAERKELERDLHDRKRGDSVDKSFWTNKKFYSISSANRELVANWLLERCKGKKILDYCCGNGETAIWCAASGADATGIDISPVSIENARARAKEAHVEERTEFSVMDAEATDFPASAFDVVVVNGALHHLELTKAYAELARILKPEGQVICTEALRHNPVIHLYRRLTPRLRSAWEVEHILGKDEINLANRNFGSVKVLKHFHLFTLGAVPFRRSPVFRPLLAALEVIDGFFLRLPIVKWQAWMAVFVLSQPKKGETDGSSADATWARPLGLKDVS